MAALPPLTPPFDLGESTETENQIIPSLCGNKMQPFMDYDGCKEQN